MQVGQPQRLWDTINSIRQIDEHAKFDEKLFTDLFDVYSKALLNVKPEDVYFVHNHDAVLYGLTGAENLSDVKYRLYNIDHHHDINYSSLHIDEVEKYDLVNVGNWVWYLQKYGLLESYTWVRNTNSANYEGPSLTVPYYEYNFNRMVLDGIIFDKIFVVKSPQWVHPKFYYTYEIFKRLASNLKDCDYTEDTRIYCEGFQSKPLDLSRR